MELLSCLLLLATMCLKVDAEVTVIAKSPVNPVKEGGILSIHCQVKGLEKGQSVTLSRQLKGSKQPTRISWDYDIVLTVVEERLFLAFRQLEDGSMVYFLSILHPSSADQGLYSCTAISATLDVVAEDTVEVDIEHFPDDPFPVCGSNDGLQVEIGGDISMHCLTQVGYPTVTMRWRRTGRGHVRSTNQRVINGTVRSVLRLQPTVEDNGAVFLCEITSDSFPGQIKTCHVGPFVITQNGRATQPVREPPMSPPKTNPVEDPGSGSPGSPAKPPSTIGDGCRDLCSTFDGPVLYWIIATIFAGVLALTLLIVITYFSIKLYRRPVNRPFVTHNPTEDAYEKLEYRRNNNRTYMELQRNCLQKYGPGVEVQFKEGQYVVTPPMQCTVSNQNP